MKQRKSIRLKDFDYTSSGAYFITICSHQRQPLFGSILENVVCLNNLGEIIQRLWHEIPTHHGHVELDEFVVMPNHIHGIVCLSREGLPWQTPTTTTAAYGFRVPGSLGSILGGFKSAVTKQAREQSQNPLLPVWQRNYFDHIIRNDPDLERIRTYIRTNPHNWQHDHHATSDLELHQHALAEAA
jgi:putative transposase